MKKAVAGAVRASTSRPMQSSDYFSLLGLPRAFALDEAALQRAYITKQREFHPDRVAKASPEVRAQAMQVSVEVNNAYHTLKSPLLRAEYLLKLSGVAEQKPSQALLMESLEAREALMEVQTPEEAHAMQERQKEVLAGSVAVFAAAYAAERLEEAAECAMRMRYLEKLLDEIHARGKMLGIK